MAAGAVGNQVPRYSGCKPLNIYGVGSAVDEVGNQVPRYSGCKLLVTNFFSATQRAALETKYRDIADVNGLYRVTNRDTGVKLETKYRDIADVNLVELTDQRFVIRLLETKYRDIADVNHAPLA